MDQSLYHTNSDVYCYAVDLAEGVDFGVFFLGELYMHACALILPHVHACTMYMHPSSLIGIYT